MAKKKYQNNVLCEKKPWLLMFKAKAQLYGRRPVVIQDLWATKPNLNYVLSNLLLVLNKVREMLNFKLSITEPNLP